MNKHLQLSASQGLSRCPYLGLHDDSKTSLAYPSPWNHCHRVNPSSAISVSHQAKACLREEHTQCEVYCSNTLKELPRTLRGTFNPVVRKSTPGYVVFWRVFVVLTLIVFFSVLVGRRWNTDDSLYTNVFETSTSKSMSDEPDDFLPNVPPFTTTLLNSTPRPTHTAFRICGHELDVVFGEKDRFVLHRIAIGENLDLYANRFQTATNAILYINYEMQMPVWENAVIVIPVDTTLGIGSPPFETYEQERIKISVDDLAIHLNTNANLFRKYNGFDETCSEFSGWMLIPREREIP